VVGVEQWAEIRRLYFVRRLSIKEIVRRTGHGRNTIRRALRSAEAMVASMQSAVKSAAFRTGRRR
jgi:hypothetical protein